MTELFKKYRIPLGILTILLLANLAVHWPDKRTPKAKPGAGAPPFAGEMPAEMRPQFDEAMKRLPEDQRAVIEKRMVEERAFFDSVKELPDQEKQKRVSEHMEQNPPPQIPGLPMPPLAGAGPPGTASSEGGGPGSGQPPGPGGPPGSGGRPDGKGGPWSGHVPPPEMRHIWDQNIATSQEKNHTL